MKFLNNYNQFIFESFEAEEFVEYTGQLDILESIITDSEALLKSIEAEEINIYHVLDLDESNYPRTLYIEELYEDKIFNKNLLKKGFKKTNLESTEETETFIDKTIDVKFFLIYKKDKSELEKPEYIIFQSKRQSATQWESLKAYKVNQDMRNFYDRLSSKTVEIKKDEKTYIFSTSNAGNDWQLKNINDETDVFKKIMKSEEIKAVLKDKDVTITIIG